MCDALVSSLSLKGVVGEILLDLRAHKLIIVINEIRTLDLVHNPM